MIRDRTTGISRGFAFLTFICESSADAAIKMRPHILEGREIRVSEVKDNSGKGADQGAATGSGEGPSGTKKHRLGMDDKWN